jgi:hypothetical protein
MRRHNASPNQQGDESCIPGMREFSEVGDRSKQLPKNEPDRTLVFFLRRIRGRESSSRQVTSSALLISINSLQRRPDQHRLQCDYAHAGEEVMLSIRHARFLAAIVLSVAVVPILASDEGSGSNDHRSSTNGVADFGDELPPPFAPPPPHIPVPAGSRVLWFVPSDHDSSTTCLFFMNAAPVQQSVSLQGFTLDGIPNSTFTIDVPGKSSVHACSDSIAALPPPSWASLVIVNFTDSNNYVRAILPPGMQIDGFTVNVGATPYDPRASTNTLELRFSPDVPTTTVVQLLPQDSDANATCLFLYNTSAVATTAQLRGYDSVGAQIATWNIALAAGALVRACTDILATIPPPSWAATQVINFTDSVVRLEITLPPYVKVDGFVLWDSATGTVDARTTDSNFLKLRIESNPEYDLIFSNGFD